MKKNFLFFAAIICICLCFVSCKWFEEPAEVERIGVGRIQSEHGIFFVEMDSVRYSLNRVYANSLTHGGRDIIKPADGLLVTYFTVNKNSQIQFIAGDLSEEYLEEYFTENFTALAIIMFFLVCSLVYYLYDASRK